MTEIILDWSKRILIMDNVVYKTFEVNCDCQYNPLLCDIIIRDNDHVITGVVKRKDIVFIND